MNENSNPEILITIIILSVLLAVLSVTTAFCHTERSAGYKNKVNIGKKNHIIIYPIFFVLHMTAILLFNLPFPDLTCYLSFSIGSIAFIFLIQAVIAYFTMFKKFECDTGTKVGKFYCCYSVGLCLYIFLDFTYSVYTADNCCMRFKLCNAQKSETKRNLLYADNCVCNCNFNCGCDNKL